MGAWHRSGLDAVSVAMLTGVVDPAAVQVLAAPRWLRRVWGGPVRAMTVMQRVYVAPQWLDADRAVLGPLLVHEMVHVRQWAQAGPLRFLLRYLGDYLRGRLAGRSHREAYAGIRYEVEARTIAGL